MARHCKICGDIVYEGIKSRQYCRRCAGIRTYINVRLVNVRTTMTKYYVTKKDFTELLNIVEQLKKDINELKEKKKMKKIWCRCGDSTNNENGICDACAFLDNYDNQEKDL